MCKYQYKGQWYTEQEMLDIYRSEIANADTMLDSFAPVDGDVTINIEGDYRNYINYKKVLVSTLEARLTTLKGKKKEFATDKAKLKEFSKLEREIELRLDGNLDRDITGLRDEISQLEEADDVGAFAYYADKDFQRLDQLMANPSVANLNEARIIIDFYKEVGTFDAKKDHPLFPKTSFTNSEGVIDMPDRTFNLLSALRDQAEKMEYIIESHEASALEDWVQSDRNVRKVYGEDQLPTYADFTYRKEDGEVKKGLKDAAWVDAFVMDISNGIMSHNGILPQMMVRTIEHAMADKMVYANKIIAGVDRLKPRVESRLRAMGFGLKIPGITGVSYDIFRAKDANDNLKDDIVQRYTSEYEDQRAKGMNRFYQLINEAKSEGSTRARQQGYKAAATQRKHWLRTNAVVFDIRVIPELVNDADLAGMSFGQASAGYRAELIELLGEHGYAKEIAKQKKLLLKFRAHAELEAETLMEKEGVADRDALSSESKRDMDIWMKRNDPFAMVQDYYNTNERLVGNVITAPKTTPAIDLGADVSNVTAYVNTEDTDITLESRMFTNPKEGDQVTFRNAGEDNVIKFRDQKSGIMYSNGESLTLKYNGAQWEVAFDSRMEYNYSVPQKNQTEATVVDGNVNYREKTDKAGNKIPTGYYDSNFAMLEQHEELREFHDLLMELHETVLSVLPEEKRQKFNAFSMFAMEKSIREILLDPNMTLLARISKSFRAIWDRIKASFGIVPQNSLSYAKVNPVTGQPQYRVNDDFVKSNRDKINSRSRLEMDRFKAAVGIPITDKIGRFQMYDMKSFNVEGLQVLAENLSIPGFRNMGKAQLLDALQERLPDEDIAKGTVSVASIMRAGVTNQIVAEQSFDLPTIIKLMADASMKYAARQEVLPVLEMAKRHYEEIQSPATTNTGDTITNMTTQGTRLEGERVNAVKQMNSWFSRVALGDYGSKNEFGDTRIKRPTVLLSNMTGMEKLDALTEKMSKVTTVNGRILNKEEKALRRRMQELIEIYREELITLDPSDTPGDAKIEEAIIKKIEALEKDIDKLGKQFAIVAMMDALFNFNRFKGLGWNVSSYVTNFMEGQLANMIVAATGDYFTPENMYRANHIVKGSFIKNMSFGKVQTVGARKTSTLMKRYNILQDASNELQKASSNSTYSQLNRFSPYEGTKRTEYLNQAPIMLSVLMDQKITGKDGTTSSVWDAMDVDGNLVENFATEENKANWEDANGTQYKDFASHVSKTIVNAHGDYHELRGNMATSQITGKALLMFKRWMSRQFYQRFARTQDDIELGIKDYKGRFRSHTQGTGAVHGAIMGFAAFGPLGIVAGGAAGVLLGKFYGVSADSKEISFTGEVLTTLKEIGFTLSRISVNNLLGKSVIRETDLSRYETAGVKERDIRNLKANIVDMSMTLAFVGMLLFTKALFWDDEDDKDDASRITHNILANKFMQLSGQSTMYLSPLEIYENTVGSIAFGRFIEDVIKTVDATAKAVSGEDILSSGPNSGQSRLKNQIGKTFLPGITQDPRTLGFGKQGARQFQPSPVDGWFKSEKTKASNATRRERAKLRRQLQDSGMSEKEVEKRVDKQIPTASQKAKKKKR